MLQGTIQILRNAFGGEGGGHDLLQSVTTFTGGGGSAQMLRNTFENL